ncbi:hypothetical protein A0256_22785 [Mucilaginibacter sp. PAMC 26640]|nr:hypothetical protein A0256_22785 [Mucilaginibacter sp. PAMC 26640]
MAAAPQRILIYRLGSLGDTIMVLPVFHQIRLVYPDADITLLTNSPVANKAAPLQSVLGNDYFFDRVLAYPVGTRSVTTLFNLIMQIRALKIDTLIYLAGVRTLSNTFKTKVVVRRDWWFFKAAGIKQMIGFPALREDFELVTDGETGDLEWEAKRLARRVKALGYINLQDDRYWDLRLTPQEKAAAAVELKEILPGEAVIVASTGTKNQVNHWEEYNWLNLFKQLGPALPGHHLVMIGGADEFEQADNCIKAWGGKALNLCGKTSPRVSGAILKLARVFIGHDSGPMHLAAAVGTPCAAVFSARHFPRQWYPRGNFNKIIYHKTDCAGCNLDICIKEKKKCILSISPVEVKMAVLELLDKNSNVNIA